MKAAVLAHYGSTQAFRINDIAAPTLRAGQLLVRNYASSVNPVDVLARRGWLRVASGLWGAPVLGSDFCGVVTATRSRHFGVGDEVWGFVSPATGHAYAEQVAVPEREAAHKPAGLSYTEAAALPLAGLTAYQALVRLGRLKAGQRVLINGCTGGVGTAAVQIARALGAHVTGTCRGQRRAVAHALGCHEVLDYQTQPLPQNQSFDLMLDTAAQLTLSGIARSLTATGLLVTAKPNYASVARALTSALDLLHPRMKMVRVQSRPADLLALKELVEQGKLKPYLARTFPLEEIAQAHALLERGGLVGKVAIEIS
jgi:NADPH:quinone reductase-like Zn-dependent oxidoreductase